MARKTATGNSPIVVRGANEHNLKEVDVDLPGGSLIALTGVSGSGKTSLAFDTIYAEARRRYLLALENPSGGVAQRLRAPQVARLEGLAPAVALRQERARHNPRSTVATLAGLYDYLRLLFARLGAAHCLDCGAGVQSHRFEEVFERSSGLANGSKLVIFAPIRPSGDEEGAALLARIDRMGYRRIQLGDEAALIEDIDPASLGSEVIDVVVDRLVIKPDTSRRLKGSLQAALEVGQGQVGLRVIEGEEWRFSLRPACSSCGASFREISPSLFSFNSVQGACSACKGMGLHTGLSFGRIFAGGEAPLEEALGPLWDEFGRADLRRQLYRFCQRHRVDPDLGVGQWDDEVTRLLWDGENKRGGFVGLYQSLTQLVKKGDPAEKTWLEEQLGDAPCALCGGRRLVPEALAVKLGGYSIDQISALSVEEGIKVCGQLDLAGVQREVAESLLDPIRRGLQTLSQLGLDYLTLDRRADSLSSGEVQRLRLGAALGSGMSRVLYVFDEPSVGLHPRDGQRLLEALQRLRDGGNTVLVVEHDPALMEAADYLVDLGPGAGAQGGRIVASGTPKEVAGEECLTGAYLRRELQVGKPAGRPLATLGWLKLEGARGHNLKGVDIDFPLGNLVCVTGVSGSGKSSLVHDTLYPELAKRLQRAETPPLPFSGLSGVEKLTRVVAVDQKPIGRTLRSNAATYTGAWQQIRALFADLPESRLRAYRPSHFSFNAPEGACVQCGGSGGGAMGQALFERLQMVCPSCGGRRYRGEVLDIRFKGKNVGDLLAMSIEEALVFFAVVPDVARRLQRLTEVGLGYLPLGQSSGSFSGGEAQRVKLAAELARPQSEHTLYILDEPTTGLHLEDVRLLVDLLQRLVEMGNSAIVVEHCIELVATADYVVDLGPEGGEAGGDLVGAGAPAEIALIPQSHTGAYLRSYLETLKE